MDSGILHMLRKIYELETEAFDLDQQYVQAEQQRRQALYDQRCCQDMLTNYETFSLKSLADRWKGRREQQLEQYRREIQQAQAQVQQSLRELERIQLRREQNRLARIALPTREALPEQLGNHSEARTEYYRLEFRLLKHMLVLPLQQTEERLLEAQKVLRGNTPGQLMTQEQIQQALTAPYQPAQECTALLTQMAQAADHLQLPFEIPPFFQNPVAYLASATQYTRHDRHNNALAQTASLLRSLSSDTK